MAKFPHIDFLLVLKLLVYSEKLPSHLRKLHRSLHLIFYALMYSYYSFIEYGVCILPGVAHMVHHVSTGRPYSSTFCPPAATGDFSGPVGVGGSAASCM